MFFKLLEGGSVQVPVDVDAGVIGTTAENLATAIREEEMEGMIGRCVSLLFHHGAPGRNTCI